MLSRGTIASFNKLKLLMRQGKQKAEVAGDRNQGEGGVPDRTKHT